MNGVIGGGQLGYNWQTGMFVIGIEGDFQGSDQHRTDTGTIGGVAYTVDRRIPWLATLRGRVGVTTGPVLFYFTGGGAWLNYQLSSTTAGFATATDNATTTAWTIGGGAEWMFAPRWSAKFEYLFLDGRDRSVVLNGNTFTGLWRDNIVRVGVRLSLLIWRPSPTRNSPPLRPGLLFSTAARARRPSAPRGAAPRRKKSRRGLSDAARG